MNIFTSDALSAVSSTETPDYTSLGHDGGNKAADDRTWTYFTSFGLFPSLIRLVHYFPKFIRYLRVPLALLSGLSVPEGAAIVPYTTSIALKRLSTLQSTSTVKLPADLYGRKQPISDTNTTLPKHDMLDGIMRLHSSKTSQLRAS